MVGWGRAVEGAAPLSGSAAAAVSSPGAGRGISGEGDAAASAAAGASPERVGDGAAGGSVGSGSDRAAKADLPGPWTRSSTTASDAVTRRERIRVISDLRLRPQTS